MLLQVLIDLFAVFTEVDIVAPVLWSPSGRLLPGLSFEDGLGGNTALHASCGGGACVSACEVDANVRIWGGVCLAAQRKHDDNLVVVVLLEICSSMISWRKPGELQCSRSNTTPFPLATARVATCCVWQMPPVPACSNSRPIRRVFHARARHCARRVSGGAAISPEIYVAL